MKNRTIYITEFDKKRLEELLNTPNENCYRNRRHLTELKEELNRCKVISPMDIPEDVITMNSRVSFKDLDSAKIMTYSLVFPKDADIALNRISILAPIGTALIGHSVGDTIIWRVPAGLKKLKVETILYQPEAAGIYTQ